MNIKHLVVGMATATMISGAVNAATMTETYTFTGAESGSFTSIDVVGSLGNTVTVTAGTYPVFSYDATTGPGDVVARGNSWGLGVYTDDGTDNHRVDSNGDNEALLFAFDYLATVTGISFGSFAGSFDIFGNVSPAGEDCCNPLSSFVDATGFGVSGTLVGLGAFFTGSEFKVREMTVSYDAPAHVPLPAAGWMLFAGLGGLAAAKRRKKASKAA